MGGISRVGMTLPPEAEGSISSSMSAMRSMLCQPSSRKSQTIAARMGCSGILQYSFEIVEYFRTGPVRQHVLAPLCRLRSRGATMLGDPLDLARHSLVVASWRQLRITVEVRGHAANPGRNDRRPAGQALEWRKTEPFFEGGLHDHIGELKVLAEVVHGVNRRTADDPLFAIAEAELQCELQKIFVTTAQIHQHRVDAMIADNGRGAQKCFRVLL